MSPAPIDEYEAVKGNEESIRQFLNNVACKDNPVPGMPALNPEVSKKLMDWAVASIVEALRRPTKQKRRYYERFVRVTVPDTRELNTVEDMDDLRISTDEISAQMFGKGMEPHTWGELIANIREKDTEPRWLQEILAVIKKAADNNAFRPMQATLEEVHGGKVYRPVLHAMNYDENGDGELDRALETGDAEALQRLLTVLAKLNVDFLRLSTKRLQELSMTLPGTDTDF